MKHQTTTEKKVSAKNLWSIMNSHEIIFAITQKCHIEYKLYSFLFSIDVVLGGIDGIISNIYILHWECLNTLVKSFDILP